MRLRDASWESEEQRYAAEDARRDAAEDALDEVQRDLEEEEGFEDV